jgi:hypothetical protein
MINFFNAISNTRRYNTTPGDVFLFFWQSNMDGQGQIEDLTGANSKYTGELTGIEILSSKTSGTFQTAEAGVNMRTAGGTAADFGPDLSCIKDIHDTVGRTTRSVKYASAGTVIKSRAGSDWNPNSVNELYTTLFYKGNGTSYVEVANSLITDMKIAAVFGMGGESDATIENETFITDLQSLISQIRTDWQDDGIKFFFNNLHAENESGTAQAVLNIRNGFNTVAAADPLVYIVDIDDIEIKSDKVHFDSLPLISIGQRFASAYINSI